MQTLELTTSATTTGAKPVRSLNANGADSYEDNKTFQAIGKTASGSGAVSVAVEVSNNGVNFITLGTISLTIGTAETSDGFASNANWPYFRANVVSISGTGAEVTVLMGA